MDETKTFIRRHALVLGTLLMFALTWPLDLSNSGLVPFEVPFIIYLFLGWGFIIAAVVMTGLTLGRNSVEDLLKRYLRWQVELKWYLVAFFLEAAFIAVAVYLYSALSQTSPDFGSTLAREIFGPDAVLVLYILPFFLVEILSNGEEIGWRGYILPRLQARYSAVVATAILGLVWGFWHFPKFLPHLDPTFTAWFMLHAVSFAFILTWLYNSTGGSLLLVAILHATSNVAGFFLPMASTVSTEGQSVYIIYVILEALTAVILVVLAGPQTLSASKFMVVENG